jgi:carbon-monoxide dehydrogenase medium subunit
MPQNGFHEMVIQDFSYFAPTSVEEACSLLHEHGEDAKALAGGQSLIPLMKLNLVQARYIIDLKRIPGLSLIGTSKDNSQLEIGALAKHSEIEKSSLIRNFAPLLSDTAAGIGHPLIRNRGTIGGSLSHCDPAADYCPAALALEAQMIIASSDDRRIVRANEFIKGTFETALKKGEILERIVIPIQKRSLGYSVKKLTLGHGDFPLITVSVVMDSDKKTRSLNSVAIALGGVSEKAFRVQKAEHLLMEKANPAASDFEEAARIAQEASDPQADIDVSVGYKRRMIAVVTRRALVEAFQRSLA